MAEISARLKDGKLEGQVRVWPGVIGGVLGSMMILGMLNNCSGDNFDLTTYKPDELHLERFSPATGIDCQGLSPNGSNQIIASTVTCTPIDVQRHES